MGAIPSIRFSKTSAAILALLTALASSAARPQFPVEITSELNGMEIELSQLRAPAQAIVLVENKEDFEIECTGSFRNGPEQEQRRRVRVGPEQSRQLAVRVNRRPIVVRVRVQCTRHEADEQ